MADVTSPRPPAPRRDAGPSATRALAPLLAANALFACGLFVHGFLFNFYLKSLGATTDVMGYQAAALTVGGLVALLPTGWLVDRAGSRAALTGAAAVTGAALALGAVATSPAVICAAAVAAGAGTSCWRVATAPVIMQLTASLRARALSWNVALLVATGGAWTAAGGALSVWGTGAFGLSPRGALRLALILGAAGTLASTLLFRLAAPPRPSPTGVPTHAPSRATAPGGSLLRGLPAWTFVAVALVAVWMTGSALVQPFVNIFLQESYALPVDRVGYVLAAGQWVAALGVVASGEAAHRLGSRRVLAAWLLVLGPVLWMLASARAPAGGIALTLVFTVIAPATFPLVDHLLLDRVPPARHGVMSGVRNVATEASGAVGAAAGGVLLRGAGFGALFGLAGGVSAAAGVALVLLLSLRRRAPGASRLASAE